VELVHIYIYIYIYQKHLQQLTKLLIVLTSNCFQIQSNNHTYLTDVQQLVLLPKLI